MTAIIVLLIILTIKFVKKRSIYEVVVEPFIPQRIRFEHADSYVLNSAHLHASSTTNHFQVNPCVKSSKEFDIFNPNGILIPRSKLPLVTQTKVNNAMHSNNQEELRTSDSLCLVTASRCSNGKRSYPAIQIFDHTLQQPLYAKSIMVESPKEMESQQNLGFEDMRIFSYKDDIYLIGVNLDRHVDGIPGMVLVRLNNNLESEKTWHLNYPPISNIANKNWAPLILPEGELGFIVDLDPLLIVKRIGLGDDYSETCEPVIQSPIQTTIKKMRNSTIAWNWNDIPLATRSVLTTIAPEPTPVFHRYVLMGHTKFVESDFAGGGWRIIYQHYFVVIDLPQNKVYFSKPFYIEATHRPHIEYISGVAFFSTTIDQPEHILIMYGLKDKESKYLRLAPSELVDLL